MQKAMSISIEINCQNEKTNAVLNKWQIKKHLIHEKDIELVKQAKKILDEKEIELRNLHDELQMQSYTDKRLIEIERTLNFHQELLNGYKDALEKVGASDILKKF